MQTTEMKQTLKNQIRSIFASNGNVWMTPAELLEKTVGAKVQSIYATVSAMNTAQELERRFRGDTRMNEYHMPEKAYQAWLDGRIDEHDSASKEQSQIQTQTQTVDDAVILQTETSEEVLELSPIAAQVYHSTPEVKVIPEGVKARRRQIQWSFEDRKLFCRLFLEERQNKPHGSFSYLCDLANVQMPEHKRKNTEFNRAQMFWFDSTLAQVEQEMLEEAKREQEEQARIKEQAEQEQQQRINSLKSFGTDALLGELMNRGQSLIETMLINALASDRVREAIQTSFARPYDGVERRVHESERRHNPNMKSEDRPRLKKILIFGLNKPIHQNEIQRDFKDKFDLKFLAAKPNVTQLRALSRAAEEVIVMTDSVDHASCESMKADNIKQTLVSGRIGHLREHLNKMYANS